MTESEKLASSVIATESPSPASEIPLPTDGEVSKREARPIRVIRPPTFSLAQIFGRLSNLAQYSDLLYTLSLFRLHVRYKQSALGWMWAALQPLALMGIYTFIFAHVTSVKTGGAPYPVFVFSALLPWIFFSSSIANAVHGLVTYPNLLTKMYFPREIIPLSYLAAGLVDFLIASVILMGLMLYYRIPLTWNALYALRISDGRIAMLGIPSGEMAIDWNTVIFSMLTIKGIYGREMYETWYKMTVMLESGLDIRPVITHTFPLKDFKQGFAAMTAADRRCGKVLFVP